MNLKAMGFLVILTVPLWADSTFSTNPPYQTGSTMVSGLNNGAAYSRMIRLQHNGASNGTLLFSFEDYDLGAMGIWQSTDDGLTWSSSPIATIPDAPGGAGWYFEFEPCLYELPQAVGSLAAGTLLLAGDSWQSSTGTHDIELYKSTNQGQTWQFVSYVDTDPNDTNGGIWEPELFLTSAGNLACIYSDERSSPSGYNQLLAERVSTNGGQTWGAENNIVAIQDSTQRPGMGIVVKLPNNQYVMSFEAVNSGTASECHLKFSTDGVNWGSGASDYGMPVTTASGAYIGATPFIQWFPVGGSNGTLAITGQFDINTSMTDREIFINTNLGVGPWQMVPSAVQWLGNNNGRAGYSQGTLPTADGKGIILAASSFDSGGHGMMLYGREQWIVPGQTYSILNQNSNLALDIPNNTAIGGSQSQQFALDGNPGESFIFNYIGDDLFNVTNPGTPLLWDDLGGNTAAGAPLGTWTSNGLSTQQWHLQAVGNGYWKFVNVNTGLMMGVNGEATTQGGQIIQYSDNGTPDHNWIPAQPLALAQSAPTPVCASWKLNGNASAGTAVTLTQAVNDQTSAAWNSQCISLNQDFNLNFKVYLGAAAGADGMDFVLQNDPRGTAAIGGGGGNKGYAGTTPVSPSVAMDLETYNNNGTLQMLENGVAAPNSCGYASQPCSFVFPSTVTNGAEHTYQVQWSASNKILTLFFDGQAVMSYDRDLVSSVFGGTNCVYYGFTAATGGSNNLQYVYMTNCVVPTNTATPTKTATPTNTAVPPTATFSFTATNTLSTTGTSTLTFTASPTPTRTNSPVPPTASFTFTPTRSFTATSTPTLSGVCVCDPDASFTLKAEWNGPFAQTSQVDVDLGNSPETFVTAAYWQVYGTAPAPSVVTTQANNLRTLPYWRRVDVVNSFLTASGRTIPKLYSDPWTSQPLLSSAPCKNVTRDVGAVCMFFFSCPAGTNCGMDWANTHAEGMSIASSLYGFGPQPTNYYTSASSPGFWYRELMDARYAGLSYLLTNVYGPDLSDGSIANLASALNQVNSMGVTAPVKIGMFDDTWGWTNYSFAPWNSPPWSSPPENLSAAGVTAAASAIYQNKWKPFFSQIPSQYWYEVGGHPLIYLYNAGTLPVDGSSQPAITTILQLLKSDFQADFGVTPYVVLDIGFSYGSATVADNQFVWATLTSPYAVNHMSSYTNNGVTADLAMVKWDPKGRDDGGSYATATSTDGIIKDGSYLQTALTNSVSANFLTLATWNDLGEGTGINRNYDYYVQGTWEPPTYFMDIIRHAQQGGSCPTATSTSTPGVSPSLSPTSTASATPTLSAALTASATASSTLTFTSTSSWTPSASPTPILTSTQTFTLTPSASFTGTSSSTSTNTPISPTATASQTPTASYILTGTGTPIFTLSPVNSFTPTLSFTSTLTNTATGQISSTASSTSSWTATFTGTPTNSLTATKTDSTTGTNTATLTATPSPTRTFTPTITNTFTPSNSFTFTPTSSFTSTLTPPPTFSSTPTRTNSPVPPTATASYTATSTPTFTLSPFSTFTQTSSPTFTQTPTITSTTTATWTPIVDPTPTASSDVPVLYPNPVTGPGPIQLWVPLTTRSDVILEVFTLGFRKVIHKDYPQVAVGTSLTLDLRDNGGGDLANGLYYILVKGQGKHWVVKLMVLR